MRKITLDDCKIKQNQVQATRNDRAECAEGKKGRESEAPTAVPSLFSSFFDSFFDQLAVSLKRTCCMPLRPATPRADMTSFTEQVSGLEEGKNGLNALSFYEETKGRKKKRKSE